MKGDALNTRIRSSLFFIAFCLPVSLGWSALKSPARASLTQNDGPAPAFSPTINPSEFPGLKDPHLPPFDLGEFIITKEGSKLRIWNKSNPHHTVFEAGLDKNFLRAQKLNVDVRENFGGFQFKFSPPELDCAHDRVLSTRFQQGSAVFTGRLTGKGCELLYDLIFRQIDARRLEFHVAVRHTWPANRVRLLLEYATQPQESFLGFGGQYTYIDMKGHRVPILSQEQGHGRGLNPVSFILGKLSPGLPGDAYSSYAPAAHYLTSSNRSMYLKNYEYTVFDLQDPSRVRIETLSDEMKGEFFYGESPLELISTYTEAIGRMPPLPEWVDNGVVVGAVGGTDRIRRLAQRLAERQTPISAWWLQDWVGERSTSFGTRLIWNWDLDATTYPDWPTLAEELKAQGQRVLGYINPFVSPLPTTGDGRTRLFEEARERGFLITNATGQPYPTKMGGFDGYLVDLFNPRARAWMKTHIKRMISEYGFSGWMADFGEALPFDARLYGGIEGRVAHNQYPELWAQTNLQAIREAGAADEVFFFMRSGFTGSFRSSPMFWLGDQLTTWDHHDGLKTALSGLLSSGISGVALNHSDIGGYTSFHIPVLLRIHRTRELLYRWIELNAFTSLFRTHEGLTPKRSLQIDSDESTLDYFSRFAKIYTALEPYRRRLLDEVQTHGWPIVRHLLLHYPSDSNVWNLHDQFLLGDQLLVAPVMDPGLRTRTVYLPQGEWRQLWTGTRHASPAEGLRVTVAAPVGFPAVFVAAGADSALLSAVEAIEAMRLSSREASHLRSEFGTPALSADELALRR